MAGAELSIGAIGSAQREYTAGRYDAVLANNYRTVVQGSVGEKQGHDQFPGHFGILYNNPKPTKNANEQKINAEYSAKFAGLKDWQILQKTFVRMQ